MKNLRLLLIVLVLILAGLGILAGSLYVGSKYFQKSYVPVQNSVQTGTGATNQPSQTFTGVVSCLPIKQGDTYTDTDGCALGLKTADGKYYVLEGSSVTPDVLVEGSKLQVAGSLDSGSKSLHYNVAGFINVTNITKLSQ